MVVIKSVLASRAFRISIGCVVFLALCWGVIQVTPLSPRGRAAAVVDELEGYLKEIRELVNLHHPEAANFDAFNHQVSGGSSTWWQLCSVGARLDELENDFLGDVYRRTALPSEDGDTRFAVLMIGEFDSKLVVDRVLPVVQPLLELQIEQHVATVLNPPLGSGTSSNVDWYHSLPAYKGFKAVALALLLEKRQAEGEQAVAQLVRLVTRQQPTNVMNAMMQSLNRSRASNFVLALCEAGLIGPEFEEELLREARQNPPDWSKAFVGEAALVIHDTPTTRSELMRQLIGEGHDLADYFNATKDPLAGSRDLFQLLVRALDPASVEARLVSGGSGLRASDIGASPDRYLTALLRTAVRELAVWECMGEKGLAGSIGEWDYSVDMPSEDLWHFVGMLAKLDRQEHHGEFNLGEANKKAFGRLISVNVHKSVGDYWSLWDDGYPEWNTGALPAGMHGWLPSSRLEYKEMDGKSIVTTVLNGGDEGLPLWFVALGPSEMDQSENEEEEALSGTLAWRVLECRPLDD